MHLLVSGGCGFLGREVVRQMSRFARVTVIDNLSNPLSYVPLRAHEFVQASILDEALVNELVADADQVIHLAAIPCVRRCQEDRVGTELVNLQGVQTVADAVARHGKRAIFASSAAIYGDPRRLPVAETDQPAPISPYGMHKLFGEDYFAQVTKNSVSLRLFNLYGPGQSEFSPYAGVITRFLDAAKQGSTLQIRGDGAQTRDFLDVRDAAALFVKAVLQRQLSGIFNGCTRQQVSLNHLAHMVLAATQSDASVSHGAAMSGDIRHMLGDFERAEEAFGWRPRRSLLRGLFEMALPTPESVYAEPRAALI